MRKFYQIIVNNPKKIIICFVLFGGCRRSSFWNGRSEL